MKKRIISIILVMAVAILSLSGCSSESEVEVSAEKASVDLGQVLNEIEGEPNEVSFTYKSEKQMLSKMKLACENESFKLYYSDTDLSVALQNKKDGKIFTTNPYNAGKDSNYSGSIANRLDSQVVITYLENKENMVELYSSVDCVALGQYSVKECEKGIEINLSLGEESEEVYIPLVLSKERYDELLGKLSEDSAESFEFFYTFYGKDELDQSGIFDVYPDFEERDIYFAGSELFDREKEILGNLMDEAGYAKKDYEADLASFGIEDATKATPNVKLSLRYALTEDGVDVSIPNDSLKYSEEFPLVNISLLPYFGTDSPTPGKGGYLFIPDGSGSVINMNNELDQHRAVITGKVYGENGAEMLTEEIKEELNQFYLPVFGTVRNNNSGLFGIIKSGSANAQISAYLGKPNGNYYTTFADFIVTDCESYINETAVSTNWTKKMFYLYEKTPFKDDILVSYYCLSEENASYSGMAEIYRKHLFGDKEPKTLQDTAINISTVGSAMAKDSFLGFEYSAETVFTNYSQNIEILKELKKNGCENVSLFLMGWQEDGLDAEISDSLNPSGALGGKSGFKELLEYCDSNKISLGADNNISYSYTSSTFGDFNKKSDAVRSLDYEYAQKFDTTVDVKKESGKYILSANRYQGLFDGLIKSSEDYPSLNLSYGDMGSNLTANYSKDSSLSRSQSMQHTLKALKTLKKKAVFNGANAYVLNYASSIQNLTNINSDLDGESYAVPFVQMVLNGFVNYNSEPINLKDNPKKELLKCIEGGSVPTIMVAYENVSELKETNHTQYYAINYSILKSDIKEYYDYLNKYSSAIRNSSIIKHEVLKPNVSKTTYSNGNAVFVNQGNTDVVVEGITVKAMDYSVKEG